MALTADVLAAHEVARLDERIDAVRRLMMGNPRMSAVERERFVRYAASLQARRAALETAQHSEDDLSTMSEARVNNVEATLRLMDDRLTRIVEQIHQLDMRTGRLEDAVELLKDGQRATAEQVRQLAEKVTQQPSPAVGRVYLAGGALAMMVVILLLVLLTWRLWP